MLNGISLLHLCSDLAFVPQVAVALYAPFNFSPHLTFFSNQSCHCSPVKLLEMLFSTTPYVLVSYVRRPSGMRDKTYIKQHGRSHMNAQKSIYLFHASHDILPNEKDHSINLP